jgi:hypothetical protein
LKAARFGGHLTGTFDMKKYWMLDTAYAAGLLGAALAGTLLASGSARAQSPNSVVIASEAQIERSVTGPDGKERTKLHNPKEVIVVPGDRVVFTLKYVNKGDGPASGFRATNPMPAPVQFLDATEEWAEVSVDGGQIWGKLADLKIAVKSAEGRGETARAATVEDVTHVRWVFSSAIAAGASGAVSYRGLIK